MSLPCHTRSGRAVAARRGRTAASGGVLEGLTAGRGAVTRPAMVEITQEFGFDAAHYLPVGAAQNRQMHGHSFYVEVTLRGEPHAQTGVLRDFGAIEQALTNIRARLDHQLLNEVEGLGQPTLENLARYIFAQAKTALPEIVRVRVRRPSYGQSCTYEA